MSVTKKPDLKLRYAEYVLYSPSTANNDRHLKRRVYERSGTTEYWIFPRCRSCFMSSEFPPRPVSPFGQENNPFTENPYAAPFQGPPAAGDPTSPFLRPTGAGMVTVFTCYCLPTAICLMVYGLYTYLNPETRQAFVMGEAGRTKEDILAVFR